MAGDFRLHAQKKGTKRVVVHGCTVYETKDVKVHPDDMAFQASLEFNLLATVRAYSASMPQRRSSPRPGLKTCKQVAFSACHKGEAKSTQYCFTPKIIKCLITSQWVAWQG